MILKRFAFIISDFYGGGAQKVLLNTAEGLRLKGHRVRIFTLRDKVEHEIPDCLDIVNLSLINRFTKAVSNVLVEKLQARMIDKALSVFEPEVVISCSCDKITRHIKNYNVYFWVHSNSLDVKGSESKKNKDIKKIRRFYLNRKVISVSQGIKNALVNHAELKEEDVAVIYNPFDAEFIREKSKVGTLNSSSEYFIHVGTFERRKRHDRLLRAYSKSGVDTPLFIIGKGKEEEEKSILRLISELDLEDKVTLLGYHENPFPFIAKAKALILTSDQEGLPTVLIEALLLHTPVISVDCPSGPSEILTQELASFLVPLNDENGLAEAIKRMDISPVFIEARHYSQFLEENVLPQFEAL